MASWSKGVATRSRAARPRERRRTSVRAGHPSRRPLRLPRAVPHRPVAHLPAVLRREGGRRSLGRNFAISERRSARRGAEILGAPSCTPGRPPHRARGAYDAVSTLRFAASPHSRAIVYDTSLRTEPHPILKVATFVTNFPAPLGSIATPVAALDALRLDGPAPMQRDESVRGAIRDLLRHGGYKPTGRGKPASEYLVRAATEGALGPINAAVDVCNAVSLHSALPISVVDLDRARGPFRIGVAPAGASYVFNASGQEIDLSGLLCLFDADGPCANAVRDAQRTKTRNETRATLSVVWGCVGLESRLEQAERWYRTLLASAGATTHDVATAVSASPD
jgi:DNA/RNA-binding domain of Phe-tRNA-synthetase-like protein